MSAPPDTEILVAMKKSGYLEPLEIVTLVNKLIENEKLAEAFLAYDENCRKFWVGSALNRD